MTNRLLARVCLGLSILFMIGGLTSPASAVPGPPVGGWSSENVDWIGSAPFEGLPSAVDAVRKGDLFYVVGVEDIEILDISDPLAPLQISRIPRRWPAECEPVTGTRCWRNTPVLPDTPFPKADFAGIDTNGEILLIAASSTVDPTGDPPRVLHVYDVSDPTDPFFLAEVPRAQKENVWEYEFRGWKCVRDCRWAYGVTSGQIIDLRDPAKPKWAGSWRRGLEFQGTSQGLFASRDITQVRPGILLTAGIPMMLLDARKNPARPRVLARSDGSPNSFGSAVMATRGKSSLILSSGEGYPKPETCDEYEEKKGTYLDSAWKTWDASQWRLTGLFTGKDEFRLRNGNYVDGDPPVSGFHDGAWGCSAGFLDLHPGFSKNGFVTTGAFGNGTKILKVGTDGSIGQAGFFLPYGASSTLEAFWITDEIIYTLDVLRGVDILRFTPER